MFGLGPTELIVILIIALVIFGPSRLPKVANSIGQAIREFRDSTDKSLKEAEAQSEPSPPEKSEEQKPQ
jgi:sec-independent protein translocase protein TatA